MWMLHRSTAFKSLDWMLLHSSHLHIGQCGDLLPSWIWRLCWWIIALPVSLPFLFQLNTKLIAAYKEFSCWSRGRRWEKRTPELSLYIKVDSALQHLFKFIFVMGLFFNQGFCSAAFVPVFDVIEKRTKEEMGERVKWYWSGFKRLFRWGLKGEWCEWRLGVFRAMPKL